MSSLPNWPSARVFMDTAPVIYHIEAHPVYGPLLAGVFGDLELGLLRAVTSPITLAECLVHPVNSGDVRLQRLFERIVVHGRNTEFWTIDDAIAVRAASLRSRWRIRLADALQISVAIESGCDAFLTNDRALARVPDLAIVIVESLRSPSP